MNLSHRNLDRCALARAPESVTNQLVKQRRESDVRVGTEGITQREGAVRGELGHQLFRQRLDCIALVLLVGLGRLTADGDDGTLAGGFARSAVRIGVVPRNVLVVAFDSHRRLILGTHITAVDDEFAVAVDADKHAGAGDVGWIIRYWTPLEDIQRRLDLTETLVDLVGEFVAVLILGFETCLFFAKRLPLSSLLVAEIGEGAGQCAKVVLMAVWQVASGSDPLPAFVRDLVGDGLEFVGNELVQ